MGEVVDIRPQKEKLTEIVYKILSSEVETPDSKPLTDQNLELFMSIWSKIMVDDDDHKE